MRRTAYMLAALLAGGVGADSAEAAQAIPRGTQVGTATDTLTITGTYTSGTGSTPFADPAFTITFTIPDVVSIADPVGPPPDGLFETDSSGTYTDGALSAAFSTQYLQFGNYVDYVGNTEVQSTDPASEVSVSPIYNLVTPGDLFYFSADTTPTPLYTFSNGGSTATANLGSVAVSGGASYYTTADPPFTGIATVTRNGPLSAVPEPATWAMMILGFGMVGFGLRYRRKSSKVSYA